MLDFEVVAETPAQPGVQRTWMSQFWPLIDKKGNVFGINIVAEEITAKRHLEETRKKEREFRTLAENSSDIVARFNRNLQLVYVNKLGNPPALPGD